MKKIFLVLTLLVVFSTVLPTPKAQAANLNNFQIQDYQIDYYLSQDTDGRSTLKTVETINAVFPSFDQNHGIERAIPKEYDGHSTALKIDSVTDQTGSALTFTTYDSGGNTVVRIGDANRYVRGQQNYKITYSQRDVTKSFADTKSDEFYWDTNGTAWAVPVNSLTARLHLEDGIKAKLSDSQKCYFGKAGSNNACTVTETPDGFEAKVQNLAAYENMSIAVGFQQNTFKPYKSSPLEILFGFWILLLVITLPIAIILSVWFLVRSNRQSNRSKELKVIVPEYIPPKDASVSTSGSIVHKSNSVFSAQLIDFAVRHYIKIYQTREKSLFKKANYELEIIKDIKDLKAEEQEVFRDLFGNPVVGAKLDMETLKKNTKIGVKLRDNKKKVDKSIAGEYGLRAKVDSQSAWFKKAGIISLILAILTVSPWLLIASIIAFVCMAVLKPLTDKGLELSRYLKGMEMYIKVAEVERLKMLQSPEGAAKLDAPIDTNDKRQMIKLYERVLPYTILFGKEKEWNNRLGLYYQSLNESPDWYNGRSPVFNAALFSAAISDFNNSATYSDPSNSSSGGSSGGGFSGGGGGGGGGGGW